MNYCLRHPCGNGYAVLDGVNIKLDNFGAYRYYAWKFGCRQMKIIFIVHEKYHI